MLGVNTPPPSPEAHEQHPIKIITANIIPTILFIFKPLFYDIGTIPPEIIYVYFLFVKNNM